jgi:hypothetical protein
LQARCEGILRESIASLDYPPPAPISKRDVKFEEAPQYKFFDDDDKSWDVHIESLPPERQFYRPNGNWVELFTGTRKEERIKWPSKIYKSVFAFDSKNLFGQTDELVDNAAEEFVDWLNTLGKEKSFVTKELVKEKFSVGIKEAHAQALQLDSQIVYAISRNIAEFLQMPHVITNKHESNDAMRRTKKLSKLLLVFRYRCRCKIE